MSAAYPLPANNRTDSKAPTFGTASLVFAGLTIVLPVLVVLLTNYRLDHIGRNNHNGWEGLGIVLLAVMAAVASAGLSGLVGSITGIVALARGEGQRWRSIIGLIVNVPVTLFVLYLIAVATNH